MMTTKPNVFFSFKLLLAFLCSTVINNNVYINDQEVRAPSIQNFADQFICVTREKFRVFVLKVAILGPHLTFSRI